MEQQINKWSGKTTLKGSCKCWFVLIVLKSVSFYETVTRVSANTARAARREWSGFTKLNHKSINPSLVLYVNNTHKGWPLHEEPPRAEHNQICTQACILHINDPLHEIRDVKNKKKTTGTIPKQELKHTGR